MNKMTGGQLTQIYNIATQQECGQEQTQFLIEKGYLADFFAGKWQEVNRGDFRKLGHLAPEDFGVEVMSLLRPLGITITIPAQPECVVAQCFTDQSVFAYRDSNFDTLLPETLPTSAETKVVGYELTKLLTEADLEKAGGKFTNLSQIENLILRTKKGENTGLITNGGANIFFLEVGNSVFVVGTRRRSGGWDVGCYRFHAGLEWDAGGRFFSPATLTP